MNINRAFALALFSLLISGAAFAVPHGSLVFTDPAGVVGPNDTVGASVKFTLDSDSEGIDINAPYAGPIPDSWTSVERSNWRIAFVFYCTDTFSGGCGFGTGTPYKADWNMGGVNMIQNDSLLMNPGDSLTFEGLVFTPNPAPVAAGTYFLYRLSIEQELFGIKMEQRLDGNGAPISVEVPVEQDFDVASTCSSLYGVGCSGNQIFSRTVDAIPEPETFAMMLAGLGLLGYVARRRNQKAV